MLKPLIAILLMISTVSNSYAAARKKPNIVASPTGAKIISQSDFQTNLNNGFLIQIPNTTDHRPTSLLAMSSLSNLYTLKEDIEARLPEKKGLIKLDIPKEVQTLVPLSAGQTQTVTLLGSDFAAATLARTLQIRTSPFNENLIALQQAQFSSALNVLLPPPREQFQAPSCAQEVGFKNGLDLGGSPVLPSRSGIFSQLSWPLKPFLTCVKDQGKRGSCTSFATAAAIETALAVRDHLWINLSEQALYNQTKMLWSSDYVPSLPQTPNDQTDGAVTSDILNGAKKYSYLFPLESEWEYNRSEKIHFDHPNPNSTKQIITKACEDYSSTCSNTVHQGELVCAKFATQFHCGYLSPITHPQKGVRIKDYVELWNLSDPLGSLEILVTYLKASQPLIASMAVTNRFLAIKNGFADVQEANPDPSAADQILGYHAVAIVGYVSRSEILEKLPDAPLNLTRTQGDQPNNGYFIVKNQWGQQWGDAGYVYLPADYLIKNLLAVQALAGIDTLGL